MLNNISLETMSASEALDIAKQVFRESATATRDHCFAKKENSLEVRLVQLSSVARAVWSGDLRLGKRVFHGCPIGFKHLNVNGSRPVLVSPIEFESDFAEAKRPHLLAEKHAINNLSVSSDNKKAYVKKNLGETIGKPPYSGRPPLIFPLFRFVWMKPLAVKLDFPPAPTPILPL